MTLPENLYMDPSVQDRHRCTQVGYSSGNKYWILTFLGMLGGRMKFFMSYIYLGEYRTLKTKKK